MFESSVRWKLGPGGTAAGVPWERYADVDDKHSCPVLSFRPWLRLSCVYCEAVGLLVVCSFEVWWKLELCYVRKSDGEQPGHAHARPFYLADYSLVIWYVVIVLL
jgi:hypothetical protein